MAILKNSPAEFIDTNQSMTTDANRGGGKMMPNKLIKGKPIPKMIMGMNKREDPAPQD